jgi:serine-type D-Ala-D-Ala carboxypeptidase/endopeptidase (penicillin-binding protein 4)
MPRPYFKALLLCCALGGAQAQDTLPATVLQALHNAQMPADALAAVALPLGHDGRPWAYQAQRPMQPASTMKLVTSVVALARLSPNHRGFTELRSAAPLVDGVLRGDLVLRGGGDVELGVPQLWALLLELRQSGVRHIAGDVLLDRTRYHPARFDQGLPPFDEAPEFEYNVIPDALGLANALLPLQLTATDTGVQADTVPPLPGLTLGSRMTLVDARCNDWDEHWQPAVVSHEAGRTHIELRGAFPRGCSQRTALQLIDRDELSDRLLRALWQQLGGRWDGRARAAAAPADTRLLARRLSRPWGELLRHQNKVSDNAWTRTLYLEIGAAAAAPHEDTRAAAERSVRRWFAEHGIADDGLVLDNGSGLSRSERISPWQMARLLQAAWAGPNAPDLFMSLPTLGVDGTMRNRLKQSPAAGWARLKSGTLRNVVAVAGVVRDPQGRQWAVAAMLNHEPAGKGRPVLDALVDHIARLGLPLAPRVVGPQGEGP